VCFNFLCSETEQLAKVLAKLYLLQKRNMRQDTFAFMCLLVLCSKLSDAFMSNGERRSMSKIRVAKIELNAVDTTVYDSEINGVKELLVNAAITKKEDGDKVVDALLSLEQLMRAKNKLDEGIYISVFTAL
jgi:hypothetical protein